MLGMRPKDKEEMITWIGKSKTFVTVSAIRKEAGEGGEESTGRT